MNNEHIVVENQLDFAHNNLELARDGMSRMFDNGKERLTASELEKLEERIKEIKSTIKVVEEIKNKFKEII